MIFYFKYKTLIGEIYICADDSSIVSLGFQTPKVGVQKETGIIKQAQKELLEYFEGKRKTFDIVQNPSGSDFQKKVWAALRAIPYGKTASYKDIAKITGDENASRAVGGANNKNPILIMTPCHRVVGANGALVGFAAGVNIKEELLNLEKANS